MGESEYINIVNYFFSTQIDEIYKKYTYKKLKSRKITIQDILKYLTYYSRSKTTKYSAWFF